MNSVFFYRICNPQQRNPRSAFISVKTVQTHRANTMDELNLHNTAALTLYACELGLIACKT